MDRQAKVGVMRTGAAIISIIAVASCATSQPPRCDKDYAALKAQEIDAIHTGEAVLKKVLVDGVPEDQLTPEDLAAADRMETVQESRSRYVDESDEKILARALEILSSPDVWNRHDTRDCPEGEAAFSLFCALKQASIDVTGEYEHRRTALQEVRFAIEEARPGVDYEHRMRDFNNEEKTTFGEVRGVIETARSRVAERLKLQAACAV